MIDNSVVLAALEDLAARCNGRPTPEMVVEEAKSPDHPLHDYFEWDDTEAAARYRIYQARQLLSRVRVEFVVKHITIKAPMFVRDPQAKPSEQGYVSMSVLRTETDNAREAIIAECARAAACLERAMAVAKVLNMTDEIELLLEQLNAMRKQLAEV